MQWLVFIGKKKLQSTFWIRQCKGSVSQPACKESHSEGMAGSCLCAPEPDEGTIVIFTDAAYFLLFGDRWDSGSSFVPEAALGAIILYGSSPFCAATMTSLIQSSHLLFSSWNTTFRCSGTHHEDSIGTTSPEGLFHQHSNSAK